MKQPESFEPFGAESEATESLRKEIEGIIARYACVHESPETPVLGLKVGRLTAPVPPVTQMNEACLCMTIRGSRQIIVGDTVFQHDERRYTLSAVGLPVIVSIKDASPEKPYTGLRIDFDIDLARQIMAEIDIDEFGFPQGDSCLASAAVEPELLDCVARLVRLIERPKDVAYMSDLVHRELLYRLLSGPSGHKLRRSSAWARRDIE